MYDWTQSFAQPYQQRLSGFGAGGQGTQGGQTDLFSLLKMLQGGGTNPWLAGGMSLLGGIGKLLGGKSEAEKHEKWKMGRSKELYGTLGKEYGQQAISPNLMTVLMGQRRNAMGPYMNKFVQSPEQLRTYTSTMAPQIQGQMADLQLQNLLQTLQRQMGIRQMQAGLVR